MRNNFTFRLTLLFLIILLVQFSFIYGFSHWTFIKGFYVVANKLILYFSIFGFILCIAGLFKAPRGLRVFLGITFSLFFLGTAYSEINPIDTTTEPVDIQLLSTFSNNKKLIVRHRINGKTNSEILDTVVVKDVGIFRRVYPKTY